MSRRLLCLLFVCLNVFVMYSSNTKNMVLKTLDENWEFTQARKEEWRSATVPGTVHQDLLNHDLIPNPFWGLNEEKIQWVENYDWEYKTSFKLDTLDLQYEAAELLFEGLDTYADVFLNGSLLMSTDNMFCSYKKEVRELLREGDNSLHIYFYSPINKTLPQWSSNGFDYPADNDHHDKKLSIFSRKAPYSYGWDWGIRMVTSGIWRPVVLKFYDKASIEDVFVHQKRISESDASLDVEVDINSLSESKISLAVSYNIEDEHQTVRKTVDIHKGSNNVNIPIDIPNPKLWMPNGWGTPHLYNIKVEIFDADNVSFAEKDLRIGLRTIRLIQEEDAEGESFYFEVNGYPMFAKGANYIPDDALLPAISEDRYIQLFEDIKGANMNCIRVWGGGAYESDLFYQLADENGILIWQDFMFACTTYPHDPTFIERVKAEAEYNVKRLRNHPSIALWCGNNEIEEGIKYWGWNKRYDDRTYNEMKKGYRYLFHETLPQIVSQNHESCSYVHGSPFSANWGRPESWKSGDSHNWGIWYGRKPFESLDIELSRFMSEFGFQSFPEMKTIATFAEETEYQIESEVMNAHQKSSVGNELIEASMKLYYRVPQSFEDFVYVGSVLQGRGMRHGFEAHRRNKPYCMGTLYWQLNDSWPVVSWSSIDYYGNWKALHYQAKRAFAPLALNVYLNENQAEVYILSDLLTAHKNLILEYEVVNFYGEKLKKGSIKGIDLAANQNTLVGTYPISNIITPQDKNKVYLHLKLKKGSKTLSEDQCFFVHTKDLELPEAELKYKVRKITNGIELTLSSPTLVKDLFIETPIQGAQFTDNFFDLLPHEKRKIQITHKKLGVEIQNSQLKFNHIKKTY